MHSQEKFRRWLNSRLTEKKIAKEAFADALGKTRQSLYLRLSDEETPKHQPFSEEEIAAAENFLGIIPPGIKAEALAAAKTPAAKTPAAKAAAAKGAAKARPAQKSSVPPLGQGAASWPQIPILGYVIASANGGNTIIGAPGAAEGQSLVQIKLPLLGASRMVGFQVRDHCMEPEISQDMVVICTKIRTVKLDELYGQIAVIRAGGVYYLKRIMPGSLSGHIHLTSNRGDILKDIKPDWIGVIVMYVTKAGLKEIMSSAAAEG